MLSTRLLAHRDSRPAVVVCLLAVWVVGSLGGSEAVCAQPSATPSPQSAPQPTQTSSQSRPPADSADAAATTDTVYVASGDVWAGTMEAQVRQRALFRERPAGADASPASGAAGDGVSIGGLVINDTRTTIGRDFYDVFYGRWETPEGAENVMIRVYEQPRPNVGTRLLVDVEDQTVFRANLRPRFQQIKKAARRALARAVRYVQQHYEPREKY